MGEIFHQLVQQQTSSRPDPLRHIKQAPRRKRPRCPHKSCHTLVNANGPKPERWSGKTRNWKPVGAVWLNPEREIGAPEIRDAALNRRSTPLTNTLSREVAYSTMPHFTRAVLSARGIMSSEFRKTLRNLSLRSRSAMFPTSRQRREPAGPNSEYRLGGALKLKPSRSPVVSVSAGLIP